MGFSMAIISDNDTEEGIWLSRVNMAADSHLYASGDGEEKYTFRTVCFACMDRFLSRRCEAVSGDCGSAEAAFRPPETRTQKRKTGVTRSSKRDERTDALTQRELPELRVQPVQQVPPASE